MNNKIFHLAMDEVWVDALEKGCYSPASLKSEGFIHCSKKDQLLRVANSFYKDQPTMTLLAINLEKLIAPVKWEPGTDKPDELFPHVFGSINLNAVEKVFSMKPGENGIYSFPDGLDE